MAEIDFAGGATIFSGETGSGKTMVLGAIAFALGERAAGQNVRRGAERALVTLEFDPRGGLRRRLSEDGFAIDEDESATISRELTATGKSAVRVNGRPATASYVREIAGELVDIVGQHEAQRLLVAPYHAELLDRFAGAQAWNLRQRIAELFSRTKDLENSLSSFDKDVRRAAEELAYARYALEEIDAAAPVPGEDDALRERRGLLSNAEQIAQALRTAHSALTAEEAGAAAVLGSAASVMQGVAQWSDGLGEIASSVAALQSETQDVAVALSRQLDAIEFDPAELEVVGERLDRLDSLKRKYGGSIEAVLSKAREFRATVERLGDPGERRVTLETEHAAARDELLRCAAELSALRKSAARRLQKLLEDELRDLAMPAARFEVSLQAVPDVEKTGAERVEFVFAANRGEPLQPLTRIASGGELSRVLLALVVVVAEARGRAALVFDEIDADIGGATATAVGVRLGRLAEKAQVICVTHLAQIASWADEHYVLEKTEHRNAAMISARRLNGERDRVTELARMLSGESHDVALKHAQTLLRSARALSG